MCFTFRNEKKKKKQFICNYFTLHSLNLIRNISEKYIILHKVLDINEFNFQKLKFFPNYFC